MYFFVAWLMMLCRFGRNDQAVATACRWQDNHPGSSRRARAVGFTFQRNAYWLNAMKQYRNTHYVSEHEYE